MNTSFPALAAVLPPRRGKTRRQESFPVAPRWLAGREGEVIRAFYRFVRAADDWADLPDPRLGGGDRCVALARLAAAARQDLVEMPTALAAFEAMLPAFVADARGDLPTDVASAFTACRASSIPVGRFLLALYGESPWLIPAADALCLVLQLLNHLEGSPADLERWGRSYLPEETLPAMKAAVPDLLAAAACLPHLVRAPKLRRQAAVILVVARRHWQAIQAGRNFGWQDGFLCIWAGLFPSRRTEAAPSLGSFRLALPLLPSGGRAAVKSIYGMARAWDALADESLDLSALLRWRERLAALAQGRMPTDLPVDFLALLTRHRLPLAPFQALLDGMISDLTSPPRALGRDWLFLYCDRVAGSVGELILAALGVADPDLVRAAGRALQLTNILRDLDQDAEAGRIYLSRAELFVILPEIEALYAESFARLAARAFRGRYAVRVMITLYRRLFLRLRANGAAPRTQLTLADRLIALLGRGGA